MNWGSLDENGTELEDAEAGGRLDETVEKVGGGHDVVEGPVGRSVLEFHGRGQGGQTRQLGTSSGANRRARGQGVDHGVVERLTC